MSSPSHSVITFQIKQKNKKNTFSSSQFRTFSHKKNLYQVDWSENPSYQSSGITIIFSFVSNVILLVSIVFSPVIILLLIFSDQKEMMVWRENVFFWFKSLFGHHVMFYMSCLKRCTIMNEHSCFDHHHHHRTDQKSEKKYFSWWGFKLKSCYTNNMISVMIFVTVTLLQINCQIFSKKI